LYRYFDFTGTFLTGRAFRQRKTDEFSGRNCTRQESGAGIPGVFDAGGYDSARKGQEPGFANKVRKAGNLI
jgi:hypothetical protein